MFSSLWFCLKCMCCELTILVRQDNLAWRILETMFQQKLIELLQIANWKGLDFAVPNKQSQLIIYSSNYRLY